MSPRKKKEEAEEVAEETTEEVVEEVAEEAEPEEAEEEAEEVAEEAPEEAPASPELVTCNVVGQKVSGYVTNLGGRKTLRTSEGVTYDV